MRSMAEETPAMGDVRVKKIRPRSVTESHLQNRFAHPHDTWMNHDQAVRIARRRWKRKRSKLLRQQNRTIEDDAARVEQA